ncbi:SH3 domain-containing protein [Bacillus sp. RG28]|uniref:SH3 domain-containing protein n=1 Tax=Gottfriedia endophytica TaxID=2820819 RepID=A0A940SLR9_9BACI|nr:SH3 domain-containing protein [Gottfriedia endophytica]MBP0726588.1 SH3 domain-containing protein [Gottfriedia endophytica]
MNRHTIMKIIALVLITILGASGFNLENETKLVDASTISGKVNAKTLNIRSGPGTNYKVVSQLKKGNYVSIIGSKFGWYKIASGLKTGWVFNKYISKLPSISEKTVVDQLKTLGNSKQVILVTASNEQSRNVTIETYEKFDNSWKKLHTYSGVIGKNGMTSIKREGDYKTPEGKYTITTAFGRQNNPGTKLTYKRITTNDVWVDDSNSKLYNSWQLASENKGRWDSAEQMNISLYDYGFVINYNMSRIPYKGSAIFFHVEGSSGYTAGCTATSKSNVLAILKWLDPDKSPVIIQTPVNKLNLY